MTDSCPPERHGAAFGIASSVQALAFIVGPMGAAFFAGISLGLGFTLLGVLLAGGAATTFLLLREPDLAERHAVSNASDDPRRTHPAATAQADPSSGESVIGVADRRPG